MFLRKRARGDYSPGEREKSLFSGVPKLYITEKRVAERGSGGTGQ